MSTNKQHKYANVIIPLAIPKVYAYSIPDHLLAEVNIGKRVEIQVRNKLYAGLVVTLSNDYDGNYKTKPIISILDDFPIVSTKQMDFWAWIASYYMCTLGEVMNVALPQGLKLSSETKLILNNYDSQQLHDLTDDEFLITEALSIQNELLITDVQDILNKKTVYPVIKTLLDRRILSIKEELKTGYKAKEVDHIRLNPAFLDKQDSILQLISKSDKQVNAFLAYKSKSKNLDKWVQRSELATHAEVNTSVFKSLQKERHF